MSLLFSLLSLAAGAHLDGKVAGGSADKSHSGVVYLFANGTAEANKVRANIWCGVAFCMQVVDRLSCRYTSTLKTRAPTILSCQAIYRVDALPCRSFDYKLYDHFLSELRKGEKSMRERDAYSSYSYYPKGCRLQSMFSVSKMMQNVLRHLVLQASL